MNKLAIVIPAYKSQFIKAALDSICNQTNLNFSLYVGDDHSPENLEGIVSLYSDKVNLTYKRFDENLGGNNLVSHWNRCIELTQGEEWVWLFSDDDIMDSTCVENFYHSLSLDDSFNIYHYNINVIDKDDNILLVGAEFPSVMTTQDFLLERSAGRIKSYVVEYIFNRKILDRTSGFIDFPTAWHSDEATVLHASKCLGIKTIDNCKVNWRYSAYNITPNLSEKKIVDKKVQASLEFSIWVHNFFMDNNTRLSVTSYYHLINRFVYELFTYRKVYSFDEIKGFLKKYLNNLNILKFYPLALMKFILYKLVK